MKRFLSTVLGAALVGGVSQAQPSAIYENFGDVGFNTNTLPQIDALAFANYGTFSVSSLLPFDFQNTRYFTNRGTMVGNPGYQFDTAFTVGPRVWAENFVNHRGATVNAGASAFFGGIIFGGGATTPSYLLISATNIFNEGLLSAGNGGIIQLKGQNVNLSRGGVEIRQIDDVTHFADFVSFFPDPGIYDNYWAMTNDVTTADLVGGTTNFTSVTAPGHAVTNQTILNNFAQFRGFQLQNPSAFFYTNQLSPTNLLIQAVFVGLSDTNITPVVKFADSPIGTNMFKTAVLELSMVDTNIITADIDFTRLYLKDQIASFSNIVILTNLSTQLPFMTGMPGSFDLSRSAPSEFDDGFDPVGDFSPNLYTLYSTNTAVSNLYAAYSAEIESQASRVSPVPGLEITDFPGRVEIDADNLNLTRSRIRGSSVISIKTRNLITSTNASVDSENLDYELGVPASGTLRVQGLAKETVRRLYGPLNAWSAVWTNLATFPFEELVPNADPAQPPTTNTIAIEVAFHFLVVDARGLRTLKPVITHDFVTHGSEVVINDSLQVTRSFFTDATTFRLTGRLSLANDVEAWRATNAPNVTTFINEGGTLNVQNTADFGTDRPAPYAVMINRGLISASGVLINALEFENSGSITSRSDGIRIEADLAKLQDGNLQSRRGIEISAREVKMTAFTNVSRGTLTVAVSSTLLDGGEGAANLFITQNGFNFPIKPVSGDLLGTTIQSFAPRFAGVEHVWPGVERGSVVGGFENNLAVGRLVLDGDRFTLHRFSGTGAANALYVDFLELAGPVQQAFENGDLGEAMEISSNLVIYFADSNVPAEQLNGLFADAGAPAGRLRWVSDFAGPNSSIDLFLPSENRTVRVNRALRQSETLDTDGDGITNNLDLNPFEADAAAANAGRIFYNPQNSVLSISWEAEGAAKYVVERTADLGSPDWSEVTTYTNSSKAAKSALIQTQVPNGVTQQFFRVRLVD